jgi:hypothetical protein
MLRSEADMGWSAGFVDDAADVGGNHLGGANILCLLGV